jgi:hypothetical protein
MDDLLLDVIMRYARCGGSQGVQGRDELEQARAVAGTALVLRPDSLRRPFGDGISLPVCGLESCRSQSGARERQEADAALEQYIAQAAERVPSSIAAIYAFRGEADKMMQWLEHAHERRDPNLIAMISINPFFFTQYNSDLRFVELCNKIGVPVPR